MVAPIPKNSFNNLQVIPVMPERSEAGSGGKPKPADGRSFAPSRETVGINNALTGTPVFASAQAGKEQALLGAKFQAIG